MADGFEKEEEEEERPNPQTRRQLERMHTVFRNNLLMCMLAFPQFQQFDLCKSDFDEWYDWFYGPEIAGRKPPMADGATLKNSLKQMKENQLFWTRGVYERIMFQQLRSPRECKGKGKGKGKGKTKSVKGVYQDHLKPSPSGQKGGGTGANLEPSRDLELTAHRDRRAGRRILRMKSQTRLRQTGSQD